jgi:hypothetical protein
MNSTPAGGAAPWGAQSYHHDTPGDDALGASAAGGALFDATPRLHGPPLDDPASVDPASGCAPPDEPPEPLPDEPPDELEPAPEELPEPPLEDPLPLPPLDAPSPWASASPWAPPSSGPDCEAPDPHAMKLATAAARRTARTPSC